MQTSGKGTSLRRMLAELFIEYFSYAGTSFGRTAGTWTRVGRCDDNDVITILLVLIIV